MIKRNSIAIISSSIEDKYEVQIKKFVEDINSYSEGNYHCELFYFRNLIFTFGKTSYCLDSETGKSLSDFDYVYIKTVVGFEEQAVALAHILENKNIKFWPKELGSSLAHTKVGEYAILSVNALPIPETIHMPMNLFACRYKFLLKELGTPFVFKLSSGTKARANYLVQTEEEFLGYCAQHKNENFIAQEVIVNNGDYRVLFVGGKPGLVFKRSRTRDDTHLNNPSLGAEVKRINFTDFPIGVQRICYKGVEVLGRDMAGIDLVFKNDEQDKPYFFEINTSPQVISGSYMQEKIDQYRQFFGSL